VAVDFFNHLFILSLQLHRLLLRHSLLRHGLLLLLGVEPLLDERVLGLASEIVEAAALHLLELNLLHRLVSNVVILGVDHYAPVLSGVKPVHYLVTDLVHLLLFSHLKNRFLLLGQVQLSVRVSTFSSRLTSKDAGITQDLLLIDVDFLVGVGHPLLKVAEVGFTLPRERLAGLVFDFKLFIRQGLFHLQGSGG